MLDELLDALLEVAQLPTERVGRSSAPSLSQAGHGRWREHVQHIKQAI